MLDSPVLGKLSESVLPNSKGLYAHLSKIETFNFAQRHVGVAQDDPIQRTSLDRFWRR